MSNDETIRELNIIGKEMERETIVPDSMGSRQRYTQEELQNILNCLCDHRDWRGPIRATIHPSLLGIACIAVEFFTATKLRVEGIDENGRFIVSADGYRAGPAGDH